jgi:hypothetical protein
VFHVEHFLEAGVAQQIPFRNDSKKSKGKGRILHRVQDDKAGVHGPEQVWDRAAGMLARHLIESGFPASLAG